ncbi:hypothetical protein D3C86_1831940 [compost metagenome]
MPLPDLEGEGFDQGCLFAFVKTELAGLLIDQLQLPGDQRQAVLERPQGFVVQVHVMLRMVEQTMDVQRKL